MIRLAHQYGARIRFRKLKLVSGLVYPKEGLITMSNDYVSKAHSFSILFHEIGHILSVKKKKFYTYNTFTKVTKRIRRIILKSGLRAEIYADKLGQLEFRKHFPGLKYVSSYRNKSERRWYYTWLLNYYRVK